MDMLSFKVTEVPRPKELAQFEHRYIIWMMFKAYMETLCGLVGILLPIKVIYI